MNRALHAIALAATLLTCLVVHASEPDPMAPASLQDPVLDKALADLIEQRGWRTLTDANRMAVTLVILKSDGRSFRMAGINDNSMIYAASLPKIAILFAAMVSAQEGELDIDAALEQDLHDMIRVSCNACATRVMERVGREKLLAILQRPEYRFYDPELHGGLWVGKDYGPGTAHKRDPVHGLSHGATTFQVAHLLYELATGTLLQPAYAQRMLDCLADPAITHKFVKGLQEETDVRLWRKSGSWKNFHADSALVEYSGGRYILVGLIEGENGEAILQELARSAHQLVKTQAAELL